jgi:hypothetical protein
MTISCQVARNFGFVQEDQRVAIRAADGPVKPGDGRPRMADKRHF